MQFVAAMHCVSCNGTVPRVTHCPLLLLHGIFCGCAPHRSQQQAAATAQADVQHVPQDFVKLAHDLADAAGLVTSQYFRSTTLNVDSKSDASPVTIADRQAEEAMRRLIKQQQPQHSIFGEEAGLDLGTSNGSDDAWLWVLDPIDGTKSFITGTRLCGS